MHIFDAEYRAGSAVFCDTFWCFSCADPSGNLYPNHECLRETINFRATIKLTITSLNFTKLDDNFSGSCYNWLVKLDDNLTILHGSMFCDTFSAVFWPRIIHFGSAVLWCSAVFCAEFVVFWGVFLMQSRVWKRCFLLFWRADDLREKKEKKRQDRLCSATCLCSAA